MLAQPIHTETVALGHRVSDVMNTHMPTVPLTATIADVQALLWRYPDFDSSKFIYVVSGKDNTLEGIISFKDLFRHSPQTAVSAIMQSADLVTVHPSEPDERATFIALRYGLPVIPVVNAGKLVGIISSRQLLKIFKKDAALDVAEAKSAPEEERKELDNVLEQSILTSAFKRLPWLFAGLLGGIGAAEIIGGFEEILSTHIILASFIPLVVYLSGALSAQVQMFYVRDMAVNDSLPFFRYFGRQFIVVTVLGALAAIGLYLLNALWRDLGTEAAVISVATLAAVFSAVVTGMGVPFLLSKLLKDPASATPPIAIISSDILTVVLYFGVATLMLV